jgi:hypothetical protein
VTSAVCGADEDTADQGCDAIPFQLVLSVALDVAPGFHSFSPVILATLAQADSTDSVSKQELDLDADRPRRLDDRQILNFSGLRRQPAHKPASELSWSAIRSQNAGVTGQMAARDALAFDRARRRTGPPAGPCRRTAGRRGHIPTQAPPGSASVDRLSSPRHGVRLERSAHSIGNVARLGPRGKAASTRAISVSVKWMSPALAFSLA